MAFGVTFEIDRSSLKRSVENMESLPRKYMNPALKHAVKAASGEVQKTAKTYAPKRSGHLRRSIAVRQVPSKGRNSTITAVVGPRYYKYADGSNPGRYGHLVEDGTTPHRIFPKTKKVLMWKGKRQVSYIKKVKVLGGKLAVEKTRNKRFQAFALHVNHPGFSGRRYLRNASLAARGAATRAFIRELQARYTKGLAKETFRA